jgi:hypothetical protein
MNPGEQGPPMPILNGHYYSSVGRYSAYVSLQIQRYQISQANQQYTQLASAASDAFATAGTNLATGLAQIAAQAAVTRAQAAANAQTANTVDLASLLSTVDTTA